MEIHEIRPEGEEGKKRTRASQKTPITISIPYSLDPCFCSSRNLHTQEVGGIFELVVIPFTKRFPTAILVAERFSAPCSGRPCLTRPTPQPHVLVSYVPATARTPLSTLYNNIIFGHKAAMVYIFLHSSAFHIPVTIRGETPNSKLWLPYLLPLHNGGHYGCLHIGTTASNHVRLPSHLANVRRLGCR